MRSSAAEREQVIDVLKTAFADGRLTQEEYEDRIGLALRPLTYADLAALTSDLPAGLPGSVRPPLPGHQPPPASRPVNGMAVASLVSAVALPFVPLLAVLLGLIAHGQIQGRGERGAGLATAGMILGGLLGLVFIILVLHRLARCYLAARVPGCSATRLLGHAALHEQALGVAAGQLFVAGLA